MYIVVVFLVGFLVGGMIEYALTFLFEFLEKKPLRINHRFTIGKRISLLSLPIWGILAILFTMKSYSYLTLFFSSAVLGTILEGMLGRFIRRFFGVNIWTYKHGSIGNFTSLYSLPYWGAAGLVFGMLGKILGI